jgi:hypothetical protein
VAAQTLARTLRPESLQLVVFFSSIAARLGQRWTDRLRSRQLKR